MKFYWNMNFSCELHGLFLYLKYDMLLILCHSHQYQTNYTLMIMNYIQQFLTTLNLRFAHHDYMKVKQFSLSDKEKK